MKRNEVKEMSTYVQCRYYRLALMEINHVHEWNQLTPLLAKLILLRWMSEQKSELVGQEMQTT